MATKETPVKTPVRVPARRGNRGGGALKTGNPGNKGGGRLPSAIRETCRGSFDNRIKVLESIADGEPIERISVSLASVVGHMKCPKCSAALVPNDAAETFLTTIQAKGSARAGDRIRATEALGKYGLGDMQIETSSPMLQECIKKWRELISTRQTWTADELDAEFGRIWDAEYAWATRGT
jgi:hypothetical protein